MDVKKILMISLIAVAVVASFSAVSAGLLDSLNAEGSSDNVVEIENITFNTTNATKFEYLEIDEDGWLVYVSEDLEHYCAIVNDSDMNDSQYAAEIKELKDELAANGTVQKINGVDVYSYNGDVENDTEMFYSTFVIDDDLKFVVEFDSVNPDEAAKMASTFKFK